MIGLATGQPLALFLDRSEVVILVQEEVQASEGWQHLPSCLAEAVASFALGIGDLLLRALIASLPAAR